VIVNTRKGLRLLALCAGSALLAISILAGPPKEFGGKKTLNPLARAAQTHGPLVGAVTDTSAKIFARTNKPATVAIETTTNPDVWPGVRSDSIQTAEESDDTAIVPITGLTAETKYYYRILVDGMPQQSAPYPSFRTFPPPGSFRDFTFIVISDTDHVPDGQDAPVYAKVDEEDPAFVIQIGDFDHSVPLTLDQMRRQHQDVRDGPYPSSIAFHEHIAPRFPFFHVWDDHDYGTNDSDKTFPGRADALKAFKEYYPVPDLPNPDAGIWHKFRYAQCEFFMLDLRSQRDPNASADGPDKSMLDGDNIPNGQKQWLKDSLVGSTARWKFIITSVPFNRTSKYARRDAWSGFGTERTEILDFLSQNAIGGVIFLSGDLHSGGGIDNGTYSGRPEMNVPHTNMVHGDTGALGQWSEGILSGEGEDRAGYGVIRVLRNPDRVVLETRGLDGVLRKTYEVD
jgi:alkaline phosphatase D